MICLDLIINTISRVHLSTVVITRESRYISPQYSQPTIRHSTGQLFGFIIQE
jgi:hypothetical protein